MPEFKKRPKMDKSKTRPTTIPPKQAAHILKEKYRKQLDQRPEGSESETTDAVDKVEEAGRRTVDEIMGHSLQSSRGQAFIKQREGKERPINEGEKSKSRSINQLKTKTAQEQAKFHQLSSGTPRRRAALALTTPGKDLALSSGLTHPQEAGWQIFNSHQWSNSRSQSSVCGGNTTVKPPKQPHLLKERPCTIFKSKTGVPGKAPGPAPKVKPDTKAVKAVKQIAQQHMRQQAVTRAKQAAKATGNVGKKIATAVTKAITSLTGGLVGLLGGSVLLVILIFVVAIAAIANSPFGIFFSGGGGTGGSSVPTVSVSEAVGIVNMEYNTKLAQLQSGNYDSITLAGQAADWPDVLAVFASRYAAAENGIDVATLDTDRVGKLTATFWDMTDISSEVEAVHHTDSGPSDEADDSWTEYILHITVTPKTAEEMKTAYSFTDYQISALEELMADRGALASLAGSLEITNLDVKAVLDALPGDLPADRQRAVETALQLVGKVNYFWGGKSYAMGWDSRWGQLFKVTADGSSSTGTYRPYGLDCTGFIGWVLCNANLPNDGNWHIGINLREVPQTEALPGDMALYSDASHIGIVVGRDSAGKLLICHCSSKYNNVVITEFATSGFSILGRPDIYR